MNTLVLTLVAKPIGSRATSELPRCSASRFRHRCGYARITSLSDEGRLLRALALLAPGGCALALGAT